MLRHLWRSPLGRELRPADDPVNGLGSVPPEKMDGGSLSPNILGVVSQETLSQKHPAKLLLDS